MTARRFAALWAVGAGVLAPLHGLLPAVGSGLVAACVGGAFLAAGGQAQDKRFRRALAAVLVFCSLLWIGALTA